MELIDELIRYLKILLHCVVKNIERNTYCCESLVVMGLDLSLVDHFDSSSIQGLAVRSG